MPSVAVAMSSGVTPCDRGQSACHAVTSDPLLDIALHARIISTRRRQTFSITPMIRLSSASSGSCGRWTWDLGAGWSGRMPSGSGRLRLSSSFLSAALSLCRREISASSAVRSSGTSWHCQPAGAAIAHRDLAGAAVEPQVAVVGAMEGEARVAAFRRATAGAARPPPPSAEPAIDDDGQQARPDHPELLRIRGAAARPPRSTSDAAALTISDPPQNRAGCHADAHRRTDAHLNGAAMAVSAPSATL